MQSRLLTASVAGGLFAVARGQAGVTTNCPLQGQTFPAPRHPANSSALQAFSASLDNYVQASFPDGVDSQNTSFSIEVFTGSSSDLLIDYHYSASALESSLTGGSLNKNTIYRIGSCTKLFSAYAWLIESGFSHFEDPITKYVPELEAIASASNTEDTSLDDFSWSDITIGALLSHLGGLPRDFSFEDFANQAAVTVDPGQYGLPTLNASEVPACGVGNGLTLCSRAEFFEHMKIYHPVVQPFSRTTYSNVAFMLMGYAFENVTGLTFEAALNKTIIDPLGLKSTSIVLPADLSNAIIPPGNDTLEVMFYLDGGDLAPAASLYTTPSEMAAMGRSILNSTLLSGRDTRRWMKPQSFTSRNSTAIGSPWEIYRYELPLSTNSSNTRLLDWYTKRGEIGKYSAVIALDAEHNIGFSVMAAGDATDAVVVALGSMLSENLAAVLEEAAREEAGAAFVGTYISDDSLSNVTISLDDGRPGLGVASWFNDGVDIMASIKQILQITEPSINPSLRLYPSSLGTGTTVGFRATIESLPSAQDDGLFSANCMTWAYMNAYVYGYVGLDEFIFKLGCDGRATAISPRTMRTTLNKTN